MSESGGMWDQPRLIALTNTFMKILEGEVDRGSVDPKKLASVEFLEPMWNALEDLHGMSGVVAQARHHLVSVYVGEYSFPSVRALYAALRGVDIDLAAFKEVSPDTLSVSVQLFLEGGYWGEAYSLMEWRCQTRASQMFGLDTYFLREETDDWGV